MLLPVQEREEQRARSEAGKLEINARSRELCSKRGDEDVITRLTNQGHLMKLKVPYMRLTFRLCSALLVPVTGDTVLA